MDNYQIFISYRRDGGEMLGQLLHDRLTQKGYKVFFDVESLRSGKFNEELYRVMDSCTDVIVVLPPNALDRCKDEEDWVRKEISFCIAKKKNIIPIMMRNFTFPENLPEDIAEISDYNGISAGEIASFPWVLENLTSKFLHSKPKKSDSITENTNEKISPALRILNFIKMLVCILFLAFPFLAQWFNLDLSPLPDSVEKYVALYANYDLKVIVLIFAVFIAFVMFFRKNDFEYIQTHNKDKNINENLLNLSHDKFITELLSMPYMASIVKNTDEAFEAPSGYVQYKCFNGIETGSFEGKTLDYFYVDFSELPSSENFNVLYLDRNTGKQKAIHFLSKQGFVFCDEKDDLLHFSKENMHLRLAYTEAGMHMLSIEISRSEKMTRIREKTLKAWEESFVREARLGLKNIAFNIKKLFKKIQNVFLKLKPWIQTLIKIVLFVILAAFILFLHYKAKDTESIHTLSQMTEKAKEYISKGN